MTSDRLRDRLAEAIYNAATPSLPWNEVVSNPNFAAIAEEHYRRADAVLPTVTEEASQEALQLTDGYEQVYRTSQTEIIDLTDQVEDLHTADTRAIRAAGRRDGIRQVLAHLADLEAAARHGRPEAYPRDWMRRHPSRWCQILRWAMLIVRGWAQGHGITVPSATARAEVLEQELRNARAQALAEAQRADRLERQLQQMREEQDRLLGRPIEVGHDTVDQQLAVLRAAIHQTADGTPVANPDTVAAVPRLVATVEALLSGHRPMSVYAHAGNGDCCQHCGGDPDEDGHPADEYGEPVCMDTPLAPECEHCRDVLDDRDDYQWPCPLVRTAAEVLGAEAPEVARRLGLPL